MEAREAVQHEADPGISILVVEDDQGLRRLIERNLSRAGFRTGSAATGGEAIAKVHDDPSLLLLLDYQLPDMTGKQVIERLAESQRPVPFVIMTGQGDERVAVEMMKLGARDYVVKDAAFMDLLPQVVKSVVREVTAERKLDEAEARLRETRRSVFTLLGNLPGMAYRCQSDRARAMVFVSEGCLSLTGFEPLELTGGRGISYAEMIHPDDRDPVLNKIQASLDGRRPFQVVYRLRTRDGGEKWVWEKGTGVFSADGRLEAVEGFITDITDTKKAEAEAIEYAKQLETLFNTGVTLSQTLNLQDLLNAVLRRVLEAVDTDAGAIFLLEGEESELVLRAYAGVSEKLAGKVERLKAGEGFTRQALVSRKPLVAKNIAADAELQCLGVGSEGLQALAAVPVSVKDRVVGLVVVATRTARTFSDRDVRLLEAIANQIGMAIDNSRLYEETVQLAFTDGLTGLYNRRYLVEQMERELARARRLGTSLSAIMIDLDGLKTINDSHGHRDGDRFLCAVAEVIKRGTRASDMAARWGGDEFLLLAPDTDSSAAILLGERIREQVEGSFLQVGGKPTAISVSVGISTFPTHAAEVTELFQRADEALYEAKRLGKNRVCVAAPVAQNAGNAGAGAQTPSP